MIQNMLRGRRDTVNSRKVPELPLSATNRQWRIKKNSFASGKSKERVSSIPNRNDKQSNSDRNDDYFRIQEIFNERRGSLAQHKIRINPNQHISILKNFEDGHLREKIRQSKRRR